MNAMPPAAARFSSADWGEPGGAPPLALRLAPLGPAPKLGAIAPSTTPQAATAPEVTIGARLDAPSPKASLSIAKTLSVLASSAIHISVIWGLALFASAPQPAPEAIEIPVEIVAEAPPAEAPAPPAEPTATPPPDAEPAPPPLASEPAPTPIASSPSEPIPPPAPEPTMAAEPTRSVEPEPTAAPTPEPTPIAPTATTRPSPKPHPSPTPAKPLSQRVKPAPLSASPAPAAAAKPSADIGAYRSELYARILADVRYPAAAKARAATGLAQVSFTLSPDGSVISATLAQTSGDETLDADALATVRRASPLPPPPQGAPRTYLVPIRYRLR